MSKQKPPAWCDTKALRDHWNRPWAVPLDAGEARIFKRRLWEHGLLSPNYTRAECASKDGRPIPEFLRDEAQRQAFHLERVRHLCGDRPLPALSFYRSPEHNVAVGGATLSQHVKARATDFSEETRQRLGGERFDAAVHEVFERGGIGTQGTLSGPVRHADSRRGPARWIYS